MTATTPLLLIAVSLLAFGVTRATDKTPTESNAVWIDPRFDPSTKSKLDSLIVCVDWKKEDIADALRDLEAKSAKADPLHTGLHFKLDVPVNTPNLKSHGYAVHRKVSILIENVSISDVLAYLCQQTNLVIRAHQGIVKLTIWDSQDMEAEKHAPPVTL